MHGDDNTVTMHALPRRAASAMRAVVVVPPDVDEASLRALHAQGARGVCNSLIYAAGYVDLSAATAIASRIRDFGWHLQVPTDVPAIPDLVPELTRLPVPVVFDHIGHMPTGRGIADKGFAAMLEMIRRGQHLG